MWDIDRKTDRERETSRDIQRERERVGMGERYRKRGLERGFYTIKHPAKYKNK